MILFFLYRPWFFLLLFSLLPPVFASAEETLEKPDKTVLIAILARNKGHVLPHFLKCIENQDYPKSLLSIYINTNNNCDDTEQILTSWVKNNEQKYQKIIYESHAIDDP